MIQKQVEDGEKAGLPARGLVGAYGLLELSAPAADAGGGPTWKDRGIRSAARARSAAFCA